MKYRYHISELRKAYIHFLRIKYPNVNDRYLTTKADDALFFFRQLPEEEAWNRIQRTGDDLQNQRQFLAEELLYHRKNPYKDAGGYLRAMKEFQEFLSLVCEIESARKLLPRKIVLEDSKS